jgi:hypothetical protein
MGGVNDELRAELLERAGRDQAARGSLPPEPPEGLSTFLIRWQARRRPAVHRGFAVAAC